MHTCLHVRNIALRKMVSSRKCNARGEQAQYGEPEELFTMVSEEFSNKGSSSSISG
jgi:hypothetical protein